jgi:hypothetical protein
LTNRAGGENPLDSSSDGQIFAPWVAEPHRLWSLWDLMRPLLLRAVAQAIDDINLVETRLAARPDQTGSLSDEECERYVSIINGARRIFEGMGLDSTVDQIVRFDTDIGGLEVDAPYALELIRGLKHRLEDELKRSHCFMMTREQAKYWATPQLFGSEVWQRFPSANSDVEEAGKCLACNRGTAAVFHLMRVLETGLRALGASLNDPNLDPKRNPSWETILRKSDEELQKPVKDRTPEWTTDDGFFSTATANLRVVKNAWRNPTMHVERRYTEEEAREVWDASRAFMRHLAMKLSEKE